MAIYSDWPAVKRKRDRLRARLELLAAGVGLVSGLLAFSVIQYDLTGFDYQAHHSAYVLWSIIMSALGFLVAGPLVFLLLEDQLVRPKVNQWVSDQSVERRLKERNELSAN